MRVSLLVCKKTAEYTNTWGQLPNSQCALNNDQQPCYCVCEATYTELSYTYWRLPALSTFLLIYSKYNVWAGHCDH